MMFILCLYILFQVFILIIFNDMIADILSNKKLEPIVNKLLIWGRKLSISNVFISQSYFSVPYKMLSWK